MFMVSKSQWDLQIHTNSNYIITLYVKNMVNENDTLVSWESEFVI